MSSVVPIGVLVEVMKYGMIKSERRCGRCSGGLNRPRVGLGVWKRAYRGTCHFVPTLSTLRMGDNGECGSTTGFWYSYECKAIIAICPCC